MRTTQNVEITNDRITFQQVEIQNAECLNFNILSKVYSYLDKLFVIGFDRCSMQKIFAIDFTSKKIEYILNMEKGWDAQSVVSSDFGVIQFIFSLYCNTSVTTIDYTYGVKKDEENTLREHGKK